MATGCRRSSTRPLIIDRAELDPPARSGPVDSETVCTPKPCNVEAFQTSHTLYWHQAMTDKSRVVHSDPDILAGTPVFVGTRVPVQSLFDYIEGGDTLDEFLRQFPSVQREQAIAALELARESLVTRARTA